MYHNINRMTDPRYELLMELCIKRLQKRSNYIIQNAANGGWSLETCIIILNCLRPLTLKKVHDFVFLNERNFTIAFKQACKMVLTEHEVEAILLGDQYE